MAVRGGAAHRAEAFDLVEMVRQAGADELGRHDRLVELQVVRDDESGGFEFGVERRQDRRHRHAALQRLPGGDAVHPLGTRRDRPAVGADERAEPALHLEAQVADDPGDLHEARPVVDIGCRPSPVPRQIRGLGVEDEDLVAVAGSGPGRRSSPLAGTLDDPLAQTVVGPDEVTLSVVGQYVGRLDRAVVFEKEPAIAEDDGLAAPGGACTERRDDQRSNATRLRCHSELPMACASSLPWGCRSWCTGLHDLHRPRNCCTRPVGRQRADVQQLYEG